MLIVILVLVTIIAVILCIKLKSMESSDIYQHHDTLVQFAWQQQQLQQELHSSESTRSSQTELKIQSKTFVYDDSKCIPQGFKI